jgi:DNA/RNA-binding domain of Phe-tRNA-synthetase-like protein
MLFSHSPQLLDQFPQLSVATLSVTGVTAAPDVADITRPFLERATTRLAQGPESGFPEITAWRRAFSQMGLKPTQYRCAPEALLRRFRKDGSLPSIHPLVAV